MTPSLANSSYYTAALTATNAIGETDRMEIH